MIISGRIKFFNAIRKCIEKIYPASLACHSSIESVINIEKKKKLLCEKKSIFGRLQYRNVISILFNVFF